MNKGICVIGQGFVGGSLTTVMSERGFTVYVNDKAGKHAPGGTTPCIVSYGCSIREFVDACEAQPNFSKIYFVCLPTPMFEDGSADLSIVESVLDQLAAIPGERIAVVKSTVPPGSTDRWNRKYTEKGSGLHVVFCPEFLTEANALDDMRNQNRIILGGPRPWINQVKQIFQTAFPKVPLIKTNSTTAEMVKYFINIHLAARVVLSCELAQVCEALDHLGHDIDYDKVLEYAKYDQRLGGTHMNASGNDGIAGARGHCFPKDLAALVYLSTSLNIVPNLMEAIQEKNLAIVAPENRDWEKMHGRAVSKKTR